MTNLERWLVYGVLVLFFGVLLIPFVQNFYQDICGALGIGWFALMLCLIRIKK
jgi:hypothetical protein